MKVRMLTALATAVLFLAPGAAIAQDTAAQDAAGQPVQVEPGRTQMQQNANESAQATTDMPLRNAGEGAQDVSYGGVGGGQSQAGWRQNPACRFGPQCNVYFGQ
jgi:hypothetical protein